MNTTLLQPEERVLSTLNRDGSRRWLRPRVSRGRFLTRRRAVAWLLIAVFTLAPYLRMNDRPVILLDVMKREFTLFGMTFVPTDTLLLTLLLIGVFVTVFLLTALFGRVWCGWACPQTVYLEFVFRPIERLLEGAPGRRSGAPAGGARRFLKYAIYLIVSLVLANTFLAYFVGAERLAGWMRGSPLDHPTPFLVMGGVTALMMFDFAYFREQTCIVACPYGRFQSVMLDRQSLIVTYDRNRGEPRGKARRTPDTRSVRLPVVDSRPAPGDCVDCHMCVTTCPTGIDIRDGLQMECIGCAQCIDACDAVMEKIGRPRGLIRYASQATVEGEPRRLVRPRVILYPIALFAAAGLFTWVLVHRAPADVTVLRGLGLPFNELPGGEVSNQVQIKVRNRTDVPALYSIEVEGGGGVRIIDEENPLRVEAGQTRSQGLLIVAPRTAFRDGRLEATIVVADGSKFRSETRYRLLGPSGDAPPGGGGK